MADMLSDARPRLPDSPSDTQTTAARMDPPLPARLEPGRQRWPPGADRRGPADHRRRSSPTRTSTSCCAHHRRASRPWPTSSPDDLVVAAAKTDKPIFVVWGSPSARGGVQGDAARAQRAHLPHVLQCGHGGEGLLDHYVSSAGYQSALPGPALRPTPAKEEGDPVPPEGHRGAPGGRLSDRTQRHCSRLRHLDRPRSASPSAQRGGQGREEDRLPGGDEDRLGRHPAQVRPRSRLRRRPGRGRPRRTYKRLAATAKKAAPKAKVDGVLVAQMVRGWRPWSASRRTTSSGPSSCSASEGCWSKCCTT